MLTAASLGLAGYGVYSVGTGLVDLLGEGRLEWWADLLVILAGLVVLLSSALVRVSMPGGFALAMAGLLGLQSIGLHNAGHLYGERLFVVEAPRAVFAIALAALAYFGWDPTMSAFPPRSPRPPRTRADSD